MLGVFDSQRKAFAQYNGAKYLHPMMRHLVFVETTTSVITGVSDELALIWKNTELSGWEASINAFNNLSVHTNAVGPLQSMSYVGAIAPLLQKMRSEAFGLYSTVQGIVDEFLQRTGEGTAGTA